MAHREPEPLHAPRSPGDPQEIKFVREQALFYTTLANSSPLFDLFDLQFTLLPACANCASADVAFSHYHLRYTCRDCGRDTAPGVAGRVALR